MKNSSRDIRVSVVVLNWNGRDLLRRFLPSVVASLPAWAEAVVADNGSTDDSLRVLAEEFPEVKVIALDRNYGFTGGYNRALAQVGTPYVVLLNSDVEPAAGWLEPLVQILDTMSDVAAVAPKILSLQRRGEFEYAGAAGGYIDYLGYPFCRGRILSTVERDCGQYDSQREVMWGSGAALCCRRETFVSLGGFCEEFFAHMDEVDLCWRMWLAGWRVMVEPRSRVYHLGGATLDKASARKLYLNYRNNLAMLYRCAPPVQRFTAAVVRPLCDLCAVVAYLVTGHAKAAGAVVKAYREFFAMHPRLREQRRRIRSGAKGEARGVYRGSIVLRYAAGFRRFDNIV